MKSIMSLEMYEKLKLKDLNTTSIPHVVGASGESLGARGRTKCEVNINGRIFYQTFIVCKHLKRPIILGRDFSIQNFIGISWTKTNTCQLTQNDEVIAETAEYHTPSRASISLTKNIKIPPRSCAVVDVDINTTEKIKVEVIPDQLWLSANPNICTYPMIADLKDREPNTVTPFVIVNFSHHEHLHLPKDHVVAFAEKDCNEGEVLEICTMEQLEKELPRNWIPERKRQEKFSEFFENPFMQKDDDFLKPPAEAPVHRKVLLEDKNISPKTQEAFDKLCEKYDDIISKNSGDIGKTMLVEMEIDTGNHPPIASKPYTLPLKHYDWVQKEIETLGKAGIIERSISPWASPVVIVPKKSTPDEPPRRRMCVDYRRINKLQPEVTKADGGKGCISLIPLPKIDELYAKLKGYKVFSSLDLRSGYYHISLNFIGISWTKTNTSQLTQNDEVIAETAEYHTPSRASISLTKNIKIPPRSCTVVDVDINTTEKIKVEVIPDQLWLSANPNICTYPMIADLKDREPNTVTPFVIVNFSHHEHLHLPKDHVVAFAEKDCNEGEVLEICTMEQLEKELPRNWIPERKRQEKFSEFFENPFMQKDDDFLKSPAEAPVHRKVLLEDKNISPKTQEAFDKLCEKYDDIILKNSGDIGKTMLVEMEIDTGNHPPIASKLYTLPLKHYDWVQKEIETLEKAGIIERSISPWASPIVIVPKKSTPGKPPRRRMCIDY